jgi:signal transduction histidine kinase
VENRCELDVIDNGPGFAAEQLDDPGNSIHWLRSGVRRQQGELRLEPRSEGRTTVRLTLPLESEHSRPRRGDRH